MKFIRLDYVDPGFYIKGLTKKDGEKTCLGKLIDKFTMTVDDVIAFVVLFSAEFLATFLLLGIGCAALSRWEQNIHDFPRSMAFGLVTLICVEIFGWISGAHMNPTVSLAALISGKLSFQKFLCYFIAQALGGLCGYGCLVIIRIKEYLGNNKCDGTCITYPYIVRDEQAFGIELIASILLAWYCCSVWDKQNQDIHESISIRFGFVMVALIFVTGFYTGGSLNPIRSFIPALYHECWKKHWIYWAGPLAGAIIGALLHDLFWRVDIWFGKREEDDELPTRRRKCALVDFSENLMKLFGIFYRKKNKVKDTVDEYEKTLFLRNKKVFYDSPLPYDDDSCPINEINVPSKLPLGDLTQQQQKQQQPQQQAQYQLQPLRQSQLQSREQPQLQSLEQPQPKSGEQPQLQPLGQSEPQLLEQPQPKAGPAPKTKVDKSSQVKSKANKSSQVQSRSERDEDEDRALLGGKKRPSTPRSSRSSKGSGKKQPPSSKPLQPDNISEKSTISGTFRRLGEEDANYPSGNWMIAGSPHFYSYKKGKKFRTIGTQTSFYEF